MPDENDANEFRTQATMFYRLVCIGLIPGIGVSSWFGWRVGGWLGLAIGAAIGVVAAAAVWFAATLLWAMTQDGA